MNVLAWSLTNYSIIFNFQLLDIVIGQHDTLIV